MVWRKMCILDAWTPAAEGSIGVRSSKKSKKRAADTLGASRSMTKMTLKSLPDEQTERLAD